MLKTIQIIKMNLSKKIKAVFLYVTILFIGTYSSQFFKYKKLEKHLDLFCILVYYIKALIIYGGIAQLGERLNGIQEVSGSIPLISTNGSA